ncbi:O-antigen ligase family protein [Solihabitans fulvus]|uniref:O-antigen ligase family protein n=2 Tax=Solihabitans fulvus TaxID=1892852 RepID=A0A5B2XE24_9PSEU|nr:O-antigen ligase family protein [Solihabitans fulvus]
MILPAKLVLKGVPLDLSPTMLFGLALGVLWFCAQLVTTLGVAKGRSLARSAMFLYAATQLATYGSATTAGLPGDELKATDRTLITLFAAIAVGLVACDGVRGFARVDRLFRLMVVGAAFMATVGALQFLASFDLTVYLTLPGLRSVSDHGAVLDRSIFKRPAGTAGHPIEYGVVCAFALPLAMHYGFRARRLRERQLWWWLAVVVLASGLMFSLSRSAILGIAVAGMVLFPFWSWQRRRRMVLIAVAFLGAMRLAIPGLVGTLYSLFANLNNDVSIQHRTKDYAPAAIEISRHLWLGRGVGTFLPEKYDWVDNQYLMTLIENGVLGVAAFALVLLSGAYAVLRVRALTDDPIVRDLCVSLLASLAVIMVASATFDLLAYSMVTGLAFLTVGACGALLRDARSGVIAFEPAKHLAPPSRDAPAASPAPAPSSQALPSS